MLLLKFLSNLLVVRFAFVATQVGLYGGTGLRETGRFVLGEGSESGRRREAYGKQAGTDYFSPINHGQVSHELAALLVAQSIHRIQFRRTRCRIQTGN